MRKFLLTTFFVLSLALTCHSAQRMTLVNGQGEEISNTDNALKMVGTGTAGTANSGVITIQGIASGVDANISINSRATSSAQVITNITLDDDPTVATSSVTSGGEFSSVVWFLDLDETDSGNDTSGTVTVDYSRNNTDWLTGMPFVRGSDGTVVNSLATNSGVSADENIAIWLPPMTVAVPYFRVVVTITGGAAGADDKIVVNAYVATQK